VYLFKKNLIGLSEFGLILPKSTKEFADLFYLSILSFVLVFLAFIGSKAATLFISDQNYYIILFEYHDTLPQSKILRPLVIMYFAVTASILEELITRGLTYKIFNYKHKHTILYILGSSLIFALAHWEGGTYNIIPTFFFGIATASLFLKYQKIIPIMVAHVFVFLANWSSPVQDFLIYINQI
jgi:membrane protease YdiL (CAAX protease family)